MIRRVINIDEEKCNGCGICVNACHEGAIGLVDGKAKLLRDDYCDGLGDCLPTCPTGAITFVEREAAAYDEAAVKENMRKKAEAEKSQGKTPIAHQGCPGQRMMQLNRNREEKVETNVKLTSKLAQWPVQIKLVPINAPYFDGANLLIAADCTAYAYSTFHRDFMRNHITLIGCPKLDMIDYSEKLTEIFKNNNIKSITVTRMTVPCCGGLQYAVEKAVADSGKTIPVRVVTIGTDGNRVN